MAFETSLDNTGASNAFSNLSHFPTETTDFVPVCTFKESSFSEFLDLFFNQACYRHSTEYTWFLIFANLLILAFGLTGNIMVIYGTLTQLRSQTASSIFILNLAFADMLVLVCCIPATLVSNLFLPWILGNLMCKITAYGQGVSVFCSVSSFVAISFDRFRAIYPTIGIIPMSVHGAKRTAICIWIFGLTITLPWVVVFQIVTLDPYKYESGITSPFPFCQEIWQSKTFEIAYFLVVHLFLSYIFPIILITACNIIIWQNVLKTNSMDASTCLSSDDLICAHKQSPREIQRRRKIRFLKLFSGITFTFFLCWLPIYGITFRLKLSYTSGITTAPFEQKWISVLLPAAQLLGSCNSCVNPVLYALLNKKFRKRFEQIFFCNFCSNLKTKVLSRAEKKQNDNAIDATELQTVHI